MFFADLERFVINGYLQRSRGASCFAVDWQKLRGDIGCKRELRVCVSVKKRLQIYQFKNETFELVKVSGWKELPYSAKFSRCTIFADRVI